MSPAATFSPGGARTALVEAADAMFYRDGVAGVTMADIRSRSGVSLRRMYALFPAKSDLVTGWLEHRHETWMSWFSDAIEAGVRAGTTPIDAIFETLAIWLEETSYRGCGFLNTLAETAELTAEQHQVIRNHKQTLIDLVADYTNDPAALAVLIDGAIVQAGVFESVDPVFAAQRLSHLLAETQS